MENEWSGDRPPFDRSARRARVPRRAARAACKRRHVVRSPGSRRRRRWARWGMTLPYTARRSLASVRHAAVLLAVAGVHVDVDQRRAGRREAVAQRGGERGLAVAGEAAAAAHAHQLLVGQLRRPLRRRVRQRRARQPLLGPPVLAVHACEQDGAAHAAVKMRRGC
eukprot:scaffold1645_cov252-Prasinococcus_capsulatus_cf.AAC.3